METLVERNFIDEHDDTEYDIIRLFDEEGKAMSSKIHGWLQRRFLTTLMRIVSKEYEVFPPVTFKTTDRGYTPDVCIFLKQPLDVIEDVPAENTAPILAVEIVSRSQNVGELIRKANEMIKAGVETCWVVEPAAEVVVICTVQGRTVLHKGEFLHHPLLSDPISLDEVFDTNS
jgi:Uma2 family endonuclease